MRSNDPVQLKRKIGRRIAERRRAQGETQEELAEKLDVSPPYVRRVEGGRENLTVESLAKIADALAVHVATLFEEPDDLEPRRGRPKKT